MKTIILSLLLLPILGVAHWASEDEAPELEQLRIDSRRLRSLIPRMLESTDSRMVLEALLILRDDLFRDRKLSDELQSRIIDRLDGLLEKPEDGEGITRRFACQVLGLSRSRKAIPVLLEALDDSFLSEQWTPVEGAGTHVEWFAVWRDADTALRRITGANPVAQPRQRDADYTGRQQKKVREAWLEWWKKNAVRPDAPNNTAEDDGSCERP